MGKKNVVWSLIAVVIAVLTVWAIMSGTKNFSIDSFTEYLKSCNPCWLIVAFGLMFLYILFEGLAVLRVCKGIGYKGRFKDGLLYSSADIYFSAITPSATGGQPACAFFMIRDGLPAPVTTVALLLNLVMYTASIMVLGLFAIIARPALFFNFNSISKLLICLGYLILTLVGVFIILLIKKESILHSMCEWGIRVLGHFKFIKHPEKLRIRLDKATAEYKECSEMLFNRKKVMMEAFLLNLIQRVCQILIPAAVYMSMGAKIKEAFDVYVTQIFVTIGSNCLPVPGAMGVSDYLLIDGLRDRMTEVLATNMELLSRGISFYISVIFCLAVVIVGYAKRAGKKKIRIRKIIIRKDKLD